MIDIYDRKATLDRWIQKVNSDLHGTDKDDVLKLIEYMQDRERSKLWIIRCITALFTLRKQLGKPFQVATKEDIRSILKWMEEKDYKASTNEKFRQVLKLFYKIVYGNSEEYPQNVKFFSVKVGKELHQKSPNLDIREYLEEDEIVKLVQATNNLQKKAFLAVLYESGARPEEFLRLTNCDIFIDTDGIILILRGKTGERRVRVISYAGLFQEWLDIHPLKNQSNFSIWVSESTNFKNKPLGIRGAEKIIENILPKVLPNKHARLYILRHSRATHLAKHLTEAQMWTFFGWTPSSQVVRHYVHLSGKDIDGTLISLATSGNIRGNLEEYKIKPIKCIRCSEDIAPGNQFCGRCGLTVSLQEQDVKERELEEQNRSLELKIDSIEANMNEKFTQLMLLIQQNPKLAFVKPEAFMDKLDMANIHEKTNK